MEVPLMLARPLPLPMSVERTATPGAVISGLSVESSLRGPPELNEAKALKFVFGMLKGVTVVTKPLAARMRAPSEVAVVGSPRAPRKGIVTVNGVPSSGFAVIGPSTGGSTVSLLTMTTARAPACWPKIALATRAQMPRFTTAIALAGTLPKSATLQPSDSSRSGVAGLSCTV
jgi:hypothetical protein